MIAPFSFLNHTDSEHAPKLVAVGMNASCYSEDFGITWTTGSITSGHWRCVRRGGGIYLAVGINVAAISTDGKSFESIAIPSGDWSECIYMENIDRWLVVRGQRLGTSGSSNSNQYLTSDDNGATWISRTLPRSGRTLSATYGAGQTVVAQNANTSGNNIFRTTDGENWNGQSFWPAKQAVKIRYFEPIQGATSGCFGISFFAGAGRMGITSDDTSWSWSILPDIGVDSGEIPVGFTTPLGRVARYIPQNDANYILFSDDDGSNAIVIGQSSTWRDGVYINNSESSIRHVIVSSDGAKRIGTLGQTGSAFTMRGGPEQDAMQLYGVCYG